MANISAPTISGTNTSMEHSSLIAEVASRSSGGVAKLPIRLSP